MTTTRKLALCITILLGAAACLRFWSGWCYSLLQDWNSVRLSPSFMLRFGPTPYPGLEGNPVTTWIYGPVPLLLNMPATFASNTASALGVAGVVNLLLIVVPLAVIGWAAHSTTPSADRLSRWAVLIICLLAWPTPSLHYIQADNAAVAFGLIANALLVSRGRACMNTLFIAAFLTALSVWSKQTFVGLVPAQVLWLGITHGSRVSIRYVLLVALTGLSLAVAFIGHFGFEGLWLNLVELPGALPFWPDPLERVRGLALPLIAYVAIPCAGLMAGWRFVWRKDSPWLLPALSWLWLTPLGCLAAFKVGGTANSLQACLFLLPTAAFSFVTFTQRSMTTWPRVAVILIAAAFVALQIHFTPRWPLSPNTGYLERASQISRASPGEVYFPWNPLVTFFSEGRFYHAEDGFYVRYLVGKAPSRPDAMKNLPPAWSITAFRGADTGWGIVEQLHPAGTVRSTVGEWTLYSWPKNP